MAAPHSPEAWATPMGDMNFSGPNGISEDWQNCYSTRPVQGVAHAERFLNSDKMHFFQQNDQHLPTLGSDSATLGVEFRREAFEYNWSELRPAPSPRDLLNSFRRPSMDSTIGSALMETPLHSPDMGRKSFYSPDFRNSHRRYYADSGFDSSEYQASPFMGHDFPEDTITDCGVMGKMFPDLPGVPTYSPPSRENSDSQESTLAIMSASAPPQLVSVPSYSPTQLMSREAWDIIRENIIEPTMKHRELQAPAIKALLGSAASKIESGELTTLRDLENFIMTTPTENMISPQQYIRLCHEFLMNCKEVCNCLPLLDQAKSDEPAYDAEYFKQPLRIMKNRLVEAFGCSKEDMESIGECQPKHEASMMLTGVSAHNKPELVSPPPTPLDAQRRSIPDSSAPGSHYDALPTGSNMSPTSKEMMSQHPNIFLSDPMGRVVSRTNNASTTRLSDMIPNTPSSHSSSSSPQTFTMQRPQPSSVSSHGTNSPTTAAHDEPQVSPANSNGEHQCTQCTKSFTRQCDLRKHLKTHERPHKCPEVKCKFHTKGFSAEKDRDRHWHDRHDQNAKKIACSYPDCSYSSTRESNVKQHMEKTHGYNYVRTKQVQKRARADAAAAAATSVQPTTKRKSLDSTNESRKRQQLVTPATPLSPAINVSPVSSSSPHTLGRSPVEQSLMFPPVSQPTTVAQSISPAMIQDQMPGYFDSTLRAYAQPADAVRAITRQVHTPLAGTAASPQSMQHRTFENGDATLIGEYHGSSDEEFHRSFFSDAPAHLLRGLDDESQSPTQAYPLVREPFNHALDASLQ